MKNSLRLTLIILVLAVSNLFAATAYVSLESTNPTPPYTNWQTAARVIQDAMDAAAAGDEIIVTNGIYAEGGRAVYGTMTNRIAVTKAILVKSVNGPGLTIIRGQQVGSSGYGDGAIRCAYLGNGAVLAGFTLSGGATRGYTGDSRDEVSGGVYSESGVVTNCVITANTAYLGCSAGFGGTFAQCDFVANVGGPVNSAILTGCNISDHSGVGAAYCTLTNCTLSRNTNNQPGGGAHDCTLYNCTVSDNTAYQGGGVANCTLYFCTLTGNRGGEGSGAWLSTVNNCTVAGNAASWRGGGAFGGALNNCVLYGNSAAADGGGAYGATLRNCTLTSNSVSDANGAGGGAFGCNLQNSIVYFNTAGGGANYDPSSGLISCCTTPLPASGAGNIAVDPELASVRCLSANSPCLGAGSLAFATGTDIDGELWDNPPSIGCDEYHAGMVTGSLNVAIMVDYTNVSVGLRVGLQAVINGRATVSTWNFGDGLTVSNKPCSAHAWTAPGDYTVDLRAFNDSVPGGVSATTTVHVSAAVHYVAATSPTPQAPYTSWSTAARTIQDAVDSVTVPGALVLVTNGTYATGGRAVYGTMTNRIAVDKRLFVSSVNGPDFTLIQGLQVAGTTNGNGAIRCVYLTNGASLCGFTLTGGATRNSGDTLREQSGGGVWCESGSATVSNCVFLYNSASSYGGGARGGTIYNCLLTRNVNGGANGSTLYNCALSGNSGSYGGGAYSCALYNCTLAGNLAQIGGGAYSSTLRNCIVYFNTAADGVNYSSSTLVDCCATPLASGEGNVSADPQLASASHISAGSPCRGAGSAAYATGADIDGEVWKEPPSIGCDEYHAAAVTGPLTVDMLANYTNVSMGFPVGFTALITGRAAASLWNFGDGQAVSNCPCVTHTWVTAGDYVVTLQAFNEDHVGGVSTSLTIHVMPVVHYVSAGSGNPIAPFTNWATAARSIQDAVDAAVVPGATVLVTNGVYSSGGGPVGTNSLVNRVAVTKPLAVRSVNGPQFTTIRGYQLGAVTNGTGAVRCVYLTSGASLSGFTLSRGATLTNGNSYLNLSGGGVCCDSTNALIENCVLSANSAFNNGGGAYSGTLTNCTLGRNWTPMFGGGAYNSTLTSCTLSNNWADSGGGVYFGILNNCVLTGNTAGGMDGFGGGARRAKLNNCTLAGNWAWMGGGASGTPDLGSCILNNCIICFNTAYIANDYDSACATAYCFTNDPLFVDYSGANLRLQSNSSCINAGNNALAPGMTDRDGFPRIVSGTVDIGAYEFQGPRSEFNAWLQSYGLPADGSADYADPDGDSMNNWQEWCCGTDPTNNASALRFVSTSLDGTDLIVKWQSVAGVNYSLYRGTNLASAFTLLATNIIGQAGTTTYADTDWTSLTTLFYRVGVASR